MSIDNLDADLVKLKIDRGSRNRGPNRVLPALVLLVAAAGGGWTWLARSNEAVEVTVTRPEIETGAARAEPVGTELLTATGYIIPRDRIDISSKIVGRVRDIRVDEGDSIREGELILKIEDDEYVAQVEVAKARVATLEALLREVRTGSRPQEIAVAQARVKSAEATLKKAAEDLERFQELTRTNVVSEFELDEARTRFDVATADLNLARENLALAEIGPRVEVIDAAEARLREAKASLAYSETQLSFTEILAPITGTILEKLAKKGELVTNSNFGGSRGPQSSVVSMADLLDLQVETDVNEENISLVRLGQKCVVQLDSDPDTVYNGVVDTISPQANRQKATVEVKVAILNPEAGSIRPEVSARVTFLAPETEDAARGAEEPAEDTERERIWIPTRALVGGSTLYLAAGDQVIARRVTVGRERAGRTEITEGLVGNELIITDPPGGIAEGTRIRVAGQGAAEGGGR